MDAPNSERNALVDPYIDVKGVAMNDAGDEVNATPPVLTLITQCHENANERPRVRTRAEQSSRCDMMRHRPPMRESDLEDDAKFDDAKNIYVTREICETIGRVRPPALCLHPAYEVVRNLHAHTVCQKQVEPQVSETTPQLSVSRRCRCLPAGLALN
jgi:hypothetical protein